MSSDHAIPGEDCLRLAISHFDDYGMGIGFTFALLCLGVVREVLGAGAIFGFDLFDENFQPWVVMILPPGGFLVLGGWLLLFDWIKQKQAEREEQEGSTNVA